MTTIFDSMFADLPAMAILRGLPVEVTVGLAIQAWEAGFAAVEVPVQGRSGQEALAALAHEARSRDRIVGAGTVITKAHVETALACGASFTVAPGLDPDVWAASEAVGLPHLPGVATPTDVQQAIALGATWVKAFPAASLGTQWFTSMRAPFPDLKTVATGGITRINASNFLAAGASAVAIGSAIADPNALAAIVAALIRK